MLKRLVFILPTAVFFVLIASQEALAQAADDQRILSADRKALVNLVPTARDFVKINQQHKILMAVVDTGVDYNHPQLTQNIHFQLDASGKPTGLGWDFTGNDPWPAPLIANSLDLNPKAPQDSLAQEKMVSKAVSDFLVAFPQHKNRFDAQRNIVQEIAGGLFHGTHVAGLMTYDEPRLGLLVYRALPANVEYNALGVPSGDSTTGIANSIKKAIQDGARVINLSLGMVLTKDIQAQSPETYQLQLARMAVIKDLAQKNPQVAFVAATGNEGAWLDERARLGMPCGIEAQNILCVGATDKEGGLASFSNVVLPDYPFILASGENILSLYPTQFCNMPGFFVGGILNPNVLNNPQQKKFFFESISKTCDESSLYYTTSGTSMATPIVSRLVGKAFLEEPSLSGAQVIQKVLASAQDFRVGRMTIKKLRAEKPSWYPDRKTNPRFLDVDSSTYFEFYSK